MKNSLKCIIESRLNLKATGSPCHNDDLLGLMIEASETARRDISPTFMNEKLRQEVLKECGMGIPDADMLAKLKLVNMVLLEALRLYCPVMELFREASKDIKLGDVMIPKGTWISIPTVKIHRRKEYWGEDAYEFNPMRFINGISKAVTHPNALLAFSAGPRACIGQNFAMLEAKTVIVLILQRARLKLIEFHLQASMASEIPLIQSKSSASTVAVIDDPLPSSPYYLHPSDNSSLILVTEPLTGQMLLMDPMPPINKVFSLIRQEERQRSIGSLNGSLNNPFVESTALLCKSEVPKYGANKQSIGHKKERPMCTHCGLLGHTMDKCYKLHGFPPGYKTRGKAPTVANQTSLSGFGSNEHVPTDEISPLQLSQVQAQCEQLLALINNKSLKNTVPNITNSHHQATANIASSSTFLVSSMTGLHPLEDDWTG
uniref:CCHC-type domain-containing protein n=1 Tax=Fagus sylvatica TaxID=28930 RepID=A0A2N9G765_FAGSY